MAFNTEYGYVPESVDSIISRLIPYINTQFGTSYTDESFQGTNFYRFAYAIAQAMSVTEVDTGEIYNKLQDYFRATNETIITPKTPIEGLISVFNDADYEVSFDISTAGTLGVCVNVDPNGEDYADQKAEIVSILALNTVAGLVFTGEEDGDYTFTNGQSFTFSFDTPDVIDTLLRVTVTISENNTTRIFSQAEIRDIIDTNIKAKYQLGNDFEVLKYLTTVDLPFAGEILFEYSINDGSTWETEIYDAAYTDLISYTKDDIEVTIE